MLSDKDLKKLAIENELVVPFIEENCEGATINLTLHHQIKRYVSTKPIVLGVTPDPDCYETIDITQTEFYLEPNKSVLVSCNEYFKVPTNMGAEILEKYGVKLLGLYISPASYMNPGYQGNMTFVAANHSPVPIKLVPDVQFCQLALFQLSSQSDKPYTKQNAIYMESKGVSISKFSFEKSILSFVKDKFLTNKETNLEIESDKLKERIDKSVDILIDKYNKEMGDKA